MADITSITLVTVVATVCGVVLQRLRQPAIVGYILAGLVLGPDGLRVVSDEEAIRLFAELGVLMLLFVVGMEISLRALASVYRVAFACALAQLAIASGVMFLAGWALGWPLERSVLLGFVLALSSTAVAIKILEEVGELRTDTGRLTVGVLIAQDLFVVPMLLILDSLGTAAAFDLVLIGRVLLAVGLVAVLVVHLVRRPAFDLPMVGKLRSGVDVAPLAALGFCFGLSTLSGFAGLSGPFGAFVAGLVIGASRQRRGIIRVVKPIESVLLMVFFVSIGLLINPSILVTHTGTIVALLLIVIIAKSTGNILILNLLGEPWDRAFTAGVTMAQVGEFSFVLAAVGLSAGTIADEGYQIALSVIALSLVISPLWLTTARRVEGLGQARLQGFLPSLKLIYAEELHKAGTGWALLRAAAHFAMSLKVPRASHSREADAKAEHAPD